MINYFNQAYSRYPQQSTEAFSRDTWNQLIRAAKDNDEKFITTINAIKNKENVNRGVDITDVIPNFETIVDHSSYLQQALVDYDIIYFPKNYAYYIKDVVIPSNKVLYGEAPSNHDPATLDEVRPVIKPVTGATTLFDISNNYNIVINGLMLNGLNFSSLITNSLGDNIRVSNCVFYKAIVGYGSLTSYTKTSFLFNIWSRDCVYTFANLQDSAIFAGAHINNKHVFYGDRTECAFNKMVSRVEWADFSGWNIYLAHGSSNVFELQSDSGGLGAVYLEKVSGIVVGGIFRRASRYTGFDNVYKSHFYCKGVVDSVFYVYTRVGDNDSNDGNFTPDYCFTFDGTGVRNNSNIKVYGDLSGYTKKPVRFIGPKPINLSIDANGCNTESTGSKPSDIPRSKDLGSAAFQDWKVITAGQRPLAFIKAASMNTTGDTLFSWAGSYTPRKYVITGIKAHTPTVSLAAALGGVFTSTGATGVTVVPGTQAYATLVSSGMYLSLTLDTNMSNNYMTAETLYLNINTPTGTSAACSFTLFGDVLE